MDIKTELPYNGQLHSPTKITNQREDFFNILISKRSFLEAIESVVNNIRDVGIIGFWSANNYGS